MGHLYSCDKRRTHVRSGTLLWKMLSGCRGMLPAHRPSLPLNHPIREGMKWADPSGIQACAHILLCPLNRQQIKHLLDSLVRTWQHDHTSEFSTGMNISVAISRTNCLQPWRQSKGCLMQHQAEMVSQAVSVSSKTPFPGAQESLKIPHGKEKLQGSLALQTHCLWSGLNCSKG